MCRLLCDGFYVVAIMFWPGLKVWASMCCLLCVAFYVLASICWGLCAGFNVLTSYVLAIMCRPLRAGSYFQHFVPAPIYWHQCACLFMLTSMFWCLCADFYVYGFCVSIFLRFSFCWLLCVGISMKKYWIKNTFFTIVNPFSKSKDVGGSLWVCKKV